MVTNLPNFPVPTVAARPHRPQRPSVLHYRRWSVADGPGGRSTRSPPPNEPSCPRLPALCRGVSIHVMCIYIYIYMCVCMYVRMYVCTYVRMYVCKKKYVYIYVCVCKYVCMYVYIYIHIHMCIYIYICVWFCMHICIYIPNMTIGKKQRRYFHIIY